MTTPVVAPQPRDRASLPALLGWFAFVVAFAYIVLIGGGYIGIESSMVRWLSLGISAIGLVVWGLVAWRRPAWRPRTAIWPALVVPFAALILTTLTSPLPRLALDYIAWAVLLVALYLLLVRVLATPFAQQRIGALLAVLGLVTSIAYIVVVVMRWTEWWDLIGHLTPPMLRPAYAGLLVGGPTVVPLVVVLLLVGAIAGLGFGTHGRRVLIGVLTITSLAAVFLSGGRGAWLALAVATVAVGGGILVVERHRLGTLLADRRIRVALAALAGVVLIMALVMAPALLTRLDASGDGGRTYYVSTALRMFNDSPLVGQGPGNWPAQRIAFTDPGEPDIYVPHPHNTYALTLAETGLVGAIAGVIALAAVLWLVVVAMRGVDPIRRRWGVASVFVLIYMGVSSVVDSYANLPVALLLAALPIAFLDGTSPRVIGDRLWHVSERSRRRGQVVVTVALFAACVLAIVVLVRVETVTSTHQRAVAAVEDGDWATALELARDAASSDPEMVPYQVTLGIASAAVGDWETAEEAFEAAAGSDDLAESWMSLALARLELGRPPEAVLEAIERGRRLGDRNSYVLLAAASLYDRLGLEEEAREALTTLLGADPSLAADPAWQEGGALSAYFDAAYEQALQRMGDPWVLAMMAGELDLARSLAAASAGARDDLVIEAWAGDPEALATLQQEALDHPRDPFVVPWAARASARAGDADMADRLRRIIVFGLEGAALPGYEARIVGPERAPIAGELALNHGYGKNDYRRPTPGHLLAPGLPSLVLVDLADAEEPDGTDP